MASSRMTMKQLKAVCDAYQQRAEKAESHCLALTRERDAANNEIRRLRSALNRRLQRWREYAIDCGGHVCACIGCDNPGLAQVEEGVWCCPRCAKRNGYEKESCL